MFDRGRKWSFPWAQADNAVRDGLPSTAQIWKHLGIEAGMSVADVGAGVGYFTFKLAERVGAAGRVLAVETSVSTCLRLRARRRELAARNVEVRWNPSPWLRLPRAAFDRVLMVNVFAFEEGRRRRSLSLLRQIARALRPQGRFVLFADAVHTTEWRPVYGKKLRRDQATPDEIVARADGLLAVVAREEVAAGPPELGKLPGYVLVLRGV